MAHTAQSEPTTLTLTLQDVNDGEELPIRTILLGPHAWSVQIGRGSQTDSRLRPQFDNAWFGSRVMSRDHALIDVEPHSRNVTLTDIGSMHGTFIGSTRLEPNERRVLYEDDVVTFGADIVRGELTYHALKLKLRLQWSDEYAQNLQQWVEGLKSPSLIVDETRSSPQRADRAMFSNSYSLDYSEDEEGSDEDIQVICESAVRPHDQKKDSSDVSSYCTDQSDSNSAAGPQQVDTAPSSPADDRNGGKTTTASLNTGHRDVIVIEESLADQQQVSNLETYLGDPERLESDAAYVTPHQSTSQRNTSASDCDISEAMYEDSASDEESTYLPQCEETGVSSGKNENAESQNNKEFAVEGFQQTYCQSVITPIQALNKDPHHAMDSYQQWSTITSDNREDNTLSGPNRWITAREPCPSSFMTPDFNKLPSLSSVPLFWTPDDALGLSDMQRPYRNEPRYSGALTMAEYSSIKPPQLLNHEQPAVYSGPEQTVHQSPKTDSTRKRKFDELTQNAGVESASGPEIPSSIINYTASHTVAEQTPQTVNEIVTTCETIHSNVTSDEQVEVVQPSTTVPADRQITPEAEVINEGKVRKRIRLHKQAAANPGQKGKAFIRYTATALAGVAVGAVGTVFGLAALPSDYFL